MTSVYVLPTTRIYIKVQQGFALLMNQKRKQQDNNGFRNVSFFGVSQEQTTGVN